MPTMDGHRIRRCSVCGISWPPGEQFKICYECGQKTDYCLASDPPDLTTEEATSRQRHWEFDRYLEKTGRS